MKLSVNVANLRQGLANVISVIDKKNTNPIFSSVLISFSPTDGLTLFATDLEVFAKTYIAQDCDQACEFCVSAKNLYDILSQLPGEIADFEFDQDQNLLKIGQRKINCSMIVFATTTYPQVSFDNIGVDFCLQAVDIKRLIETTSYAISDDEIRVFLNGIFLHVENELLKVVATNGYQLSLIEFPNMKIENTYLHEGIIIPKKGVLELKKLAEKYERHKLQFFVDQAYLYAYIPSEFYLKIRLISREFIEYKSLIRRKSVFQFQVSRTDIISAIKRVKLFSNEQTNAIKLQLTNNSLRIVSSDSFYGNANEEVEITYTGKDLSVGFNAGLLLETLSNIDAEMISFEFDNQFLPFMIKTQQIPNFVALVSPMRVQV